jgi:hypothetical protein
MVPGCGFSRPLRNGDGRRPTWPRRRPKRRPQHPPQRRPSPPRSARQAAPEPGAVVEQHFKRLDVVDHLAGPLRGRPAGVVADHPADRAVHVGRGFWPKAQPCGFQLVIQHIQNDPGFHHARPLLLVDFGDPVAVLRPVDDDRRVGALPGEAGATTAGHQRDAVLAAHRDGRGPGLNGAGQHHADGDLPEVRAAGRLPARPGSCRRHCWPYRCRMRRSPGC